MSGATVSSLFASSLTARLSDPRVVIAQAVVIFGPIVVIRQYGWITPANPVLALVVIPVFTVVSLALLVDVVQNVALRIEEQAHEDADLSSCWQTIIDRTLLLANTALIVPLLIWGQPIIGTAGYTAEALAPLVPMAPTTADHSVVSTVLVGGLVIGSAVAARGIAAWAQAQFGPDLSTDRLETYLALRAAFPVRGGESIAPLIGGNRGQVPTKALADVCVKYLLTQRIPDTLSQQFDIKRIAAELTPVAASSPAKFVFLTTLNTRFLVTLFGALMFIYSGAFALAVPSIDAVTLWIGTGLGICSQVAYNHPFVSPSREVLQV